MLRNLTTLEVVVKDADKAHCKINMEILFTLCSIIVMGLFFIFYYANLELNI